jgi:hypothetical protein
MTPPGGGFRWRRGLLGALAGAAVGLTAYLLDASPWWWLAVPVGLSFGAVSYRVETSVQWSVVRQPAGTYTEADLERVIARDFAPQFIPRVKALLSRYGREDWQREVLRVQMACLKCANGKLEALERAVNDACCDYRDVLGPAEYPTYDKARTPEAKKKAIESDWKQLQSWLNRK